MLRREGLCIDAIASTGSTLGPAVIATAMTAQGLVREHVRGTRVGHRVVRPILLMRADDERVPIVVDRHRAAALVARVGVVTLDVGACRPLPRRAREEIRRAGLL